MRDLLNLQVLNNLGVSIKLGYVEARFDYQFYNKINRIKKCGLFGLTE